MKIAVVADDFEVETGSGVARYSQRLVTGLRGIGVSATPISPKPSPTPFGTAFNRYIRLAYGVFRKANDFDLFHATSPIVASSLPFIKKPAVITYHDLTGILYKDSRNSLRKRLLLPVYLRIGRLHDKVIAVSTQTKAELVKYLGIPEEKIAVIPLGIDERFRPATKNRAETIVIGYLGALAPRKGVNYLVTAFYLLKQRYPCLKARLVICGSKGLAYHKVVQQVTELGLTQEVKFQDFVPEEKLVETYNSFDVFAFPSEWEGFGLPILEAQRCGVPVVIRENARIPQEVSKYCLKARSEEDMAHKIYELSVNPGLRKDTVEKGLEYSKQFSWERTVNETVKIYEDLLRQRSQPFKAVNSERRTS